MYHWKIETYAWVRFSVQLRWGGKCPLNAQYPTRNNSCIIWITKWMRGQMDNRNTIMRWKNSQQRTRCERDELLIERKNYNLLKEINAWVRPESLTAKGEKFIIRWGFRVIRRRPLSNSFASLAFPRLISDQLKTAPSTGIWSLCRDFRDMNLGPKIGNLNPVRWSRMFIWPPVKKEPNCKCEETYEINFHLFSLKKMARSRSCQIISCFGGKILNISVK